MSTCGALNLHGSSQSNIVDGAALPPSPPSPAVCLVATKTIHSLTVALDGLSESDHHAHLLSSSADHLGTLCCVQDGP